LGLNSWPRAQAHSRSHWPKQKAGKQNLEILCYLKLKSSTTSANCGIKKEMFATEKFIDDEKQI
ncbi:MAG: hypothetical protein ACD_9C00191G0001, partial [uncultured bacterium]